MPTINIPNMEQSHLKDTHPCYTHTHTHSPHTHTHTDRPILLASRPNRLVPIRYETLAGRKTIPAGQRAKTKLRSADRIRILRSEPQDPDPGLQIQVSPLDLLVGMLLRQRNKQEVERDGGRKRNYRAATSGSTWSASSRWAAWAPGWPRPYWRNTENLQPKSRTGSQRGWATPWSRDRLTGADEDVWVLQQRQQRRPLHALQQEAKEVTADGTQQSSSAAAPGLTPGEILEGCRMHICKAGRGRHHCAALAGSSRRK